MLGSSSSSLVGSREGMQGLMLAAAQLQQSSLGGSCKKGKC